MKSETNVIRKIRENRNPGTELDFNIKGYDEAIIRQNLEISTGNKLGFARKMGF